MVTNTLVSGDPMAPVSTDLIAQFASLPVGQPVPDGWRVLTGNARDSQIARIAYRFEIENDSGQANVIAEYAMRGDGCQAPGAIVLIGLPNNDATPFVTYFRNDQDSEREGRPVYHSGNYCRTLADGWRSFGERVKKYDPSGLLNEESEI